MSASDIQAIEIFPQKTYCLVETMLSIRIADVPLNLQSGDFYKSLDIDCKDDVLVDIPDDTLKSDTRVNDSAELEHLLKSLRYWIVSSVPGTVFSYILGPTDRKRSRVVKAFSDTFPVLAVAEKIRKLEYTQDKLYAAIQDAQFDLMSYLYESCDDFAQRRPWSTLCNVAASCGNVEALKYFHMHGHPLNDSTFTAAAISNNLACLNYLYEIKCAWDKEACALAAFSGNLDALKILHEKGCDWCCKTTSNAIQVGSLECLIYAHENGCYVGYYSSQDAACSGRLDCLKYLHQKGFVLDAFTSSSAASNGHLDCLQFLHENGCPWDSTTPTYAAGNGHLNCIQYAHKHGCEWSEAVCHFAASAKQLACLKYAVEHGCPLGSDILKVAAFVDPNGKCVKYLKSINL